MKNIKYLISAFALVVFSSCGSDFFESAVEVEIPDHTPTIVISGVIEEDAELFETYVSFSQSKNTQSILTPLSDAKVQLFKDGTLLSDLAYVDSTERFTAVLAPGDLSSGSNYRIEAEHPDYASVYAEQSMPNAISIDDFEYTPDGTVDQFGEPADRFKVTFTDRSGETNYYLVNAQLQQSFFNGNDTITYTQVVELMTLDPSIVYGYSEDSYVGFPMISDAAFPGKKYDLLFNAYQLFLEEGDEIKIELKTITRERYLYLLSLKGQYDSEDNPFAEPVTVLSNIENGNGAFGAEAITELIYKF